MHFTLFILLCLGVSVRALKRKTCVIEASGTNTTDDGPAIIDAFEKCGRGGRVVFNPTTYYVNSVLNITGLDDVYIDLKGTLLVTYNSHLINMDRSSRYVVEHRH